jgi:hypothetical protein
MALILIFRMNLLPSSDSFEARVKEKLKKNEI